ncbi:hypothetical protein CIP61R_650021 [Escherichia coli]|nr:hypothetical protein CIP61R_650021 [Escherichia coli]
MLQIVLPMFCNQIVRSSATECVKI